MLKNDEIRQAVHDLYSQAANNECCGSTCCSGSKPELAEHMGYSPDELKAVPTGANLGFGCGNPQAIAALKPGEMVLDLGSGAGFDCFLASRQVGESGQVIGVDMTQEMLSKARANARNNGVLNVEFRLGEIEHLPVADNSIDVILSNCVINLSTDKPRVFEEAFRVLKPGGRLALSDIVALSELPEHLRDDLSLHAGCMAGATPVAELAKMLQTAGFENVRIAPKDKSKNILEKWTKNKSLHEIIVSAAIEAIKPKF